MPRKVIALGGIGGVGTREPPMPMLCGAKAKAI